MNSGAIGADVSGATGLVSGLLGSSSAKSAAKIQARQASAEAQALGQAGEAAQNYLNPYVAAGQSALSNIESNNALWGNINNGYTDNAYSTGTQASNIADQGYSTLQNAASNTQNLINNGITQQSIENTPGYAAINALGQQGVTNSAAARGLANSGAAMKGAANYATTMADQTYQNLYNDQLNSNNQLLSAANDYNTNAATQLQVAQNYLNTNSANQQNISNAWGRENQLVNYGSTAATSSAKNALTAAGASANYGAQSGNALASGTVGSTNALTSGLNSAGNSYLLYNALLNGGSSF
ncbi:hypothetical protein J2D73_19220 [Acetobacter sacchari]|uniref:Uncharacterized protein n=1 Tax=Acetobacter sacchari TaxID=2661687 RepID=A0ABS3M1B0_9PROT|nr:hypothetical protein [Acetobacter sacchari]MBO1361917.1 hypothetical protein [Acetobacter sacchari]